MVDHSQSLYNSEVTLKGDVIKYFTDKLVGIYDAMEQREAEMTVAFQTSDEIIYNSKYKISDEDKNNWEKDKALMLGENYFELKELSEDIKEIINLLIDNDQSGLIELL